MAAVVAGEPRGAAVDDERDVALRAPPGAAAGAAGEVRRIAAPVDEDDRLAALGAQALERGAGARRAARRPGPSARACRAARPRAAAGESTRSGRSTRSSSTQLSGRGVAVPATSVAPAQLGAAAGDVPGVVARDRPPACRRRRAPRPRRSARGPPPARRRRCAARRRSSPRRGAAAATRPRARLSESWECVSATRSPKRLRNRPIVCGVKPISGTRTIAPRPRSSAASTAAR